MAFKRTYEYWNIQEFSHTYGCICKILEETTRENSLDFQLSYLDLESFLSYQTIYRELPRLCGVQSTEWANMSLTKFKGSIIKLKTKDNQLEKLNRKETKTVLNDYTDYVDIQKKIEPCKTPDINNGRLILVASLIDKIPNLGGLSRTCEVFGVSQYVLNNAQIVKSKEYQSLSMSSEKWVDTKEVKICDLPSYLRHMKTEGYRIVGAEQTAHSVKLDQHKFDKNTVLVLG